MKAKNGYLIYFRAFLVGVATVLLFGGAKASAQVIIIPDREVHQMSGQYESDGAGSADLEWTWNNGAVFTLMVSSAQRVVMLDTPSALPFPVNIKMRLKDSGGSVVKVCEATLTGPGGVHCDDAQDVVGVAEPKPAANAQANQKR